MANENKNEVVEVKTEQKVGLIGKAKQKASGLVNYTDKDIQKLEKEAEKAYNEFYVLDLAVAKRMHRDFVRARVRAAFVKVEKHLAILRFAHIELEPVETMFDRKPVRGG